MSAPRTPNRFHGRIPGERACQAADCDQLGEYRAPGDQRPGFDGPGSWRWFCLDHIRAFNSAYDFFAGMTPDEILEAQSPVAGWERVSRPFSPNGGVDAPPRWADFSDPLEAISGRAKARKPAPRSDGILLTSPQQRAFKLLGLADDADRPALRRAYTGLVRRYHPDHNGGDRSMETKLQRVVEAYDLLRKSALFR